MTIQIDDLVEIIVGKNTTIEKLRQKLTGFDVTTTKHEEGGYFTILAYAMAAHRLDFIKLLVEKYEMDLTFIHKTHLGDMTYLLLACGTNNLGILRYLVEEQKMDIKEIHPQTKDTLLHEKIEDSDHEGRIEIVSYLIENGVDLTHTNNKGMNALEAAKSRLQGLRRSMWHYNQELEDLQNIINIISAKISSQEASQPAAAARVAAHAATTFGGSASSTTDSLEYDSQLDDVEIISAQNS